jgi:hypothetical protein
VLLRVYAKCIGGQDELAKRQIEEALSYPMTATSLSPGMGTNFGA